MRLFLLVASGILVSCSSREEVKEIAVEDVIESEVTVENVEVELEEGEGRRGRGVKEWQGRAAMSDEERLKPEELHKMFEKLSKEQREMVGRAEGAAMAKVEGYDEFLEGINNGEVNLQAMKNVMDGVEMIDGMMFHVETMDEEGLTEYIANRMQELVDLSLGF